MKTWKLCRQMLWQLQRTPAGSLTPLQVDLAVWWLCWLGPRRHLWRLRRWQLQCVLKQHAAGGRLRGRLYGSDPGWATSRAMLEAWRPLRELMLWNR